MYRVKVPLVSAYQIILSSRAHSFNFELIATDLVSLSKFSLTKLMVSHNLLRPTVTNQIAFDHRHSNPMRKCEHPMDCCYQALASQLETLAHHFYLTN